MSNDNDIKDLIKELDKKLYVFVVTGFLVFLFVLCATDYHILTSPESEIVLPIITMKIPICILYFLASIVLLGLHFRLLFRFSFDELQFLYNHFKNMEKVIFSFFTRIFPLIILIWAQLKFSKYHSFLMTSCHFLFIILDWLLVIKYWNNIIKSNHIKDYISWIITIILIIPLLNFAFIFSLKTKKGMNFLMGIQNNLITYEGEISSEKKGLDYFPERLVYFLIRSWSLTIWNKTIVSERPSDNIIYNFKEKNGEIRNEDFFEFYMGICIENRDLSFADLRGCKIFMVNIQDSKLRGTILINTIFIGATFKNVLLDNAYCNKADFSRGIYESVDFSYTKLMGSSFFKSKTIDSIFEEAWFNGSDMREADLQNGRCQKAIFSGAWLSRANLINADLSFTKLDDVNLNRAKMHWVNLKNAQLSRAFLQYAILKGADLTNADLKGAILRETQLQEAILIKTQLHGVVLLKAQLQGANLNQADLTGADIKEAKVQGADLQKCCLQATFLYKTYLQGADLRGAQLDGAYVNKAKFYGAQLSGVEFDNSFGIPDFTTITDRDELFKNLPDESKGNYDERIKNFNQKPLPYLNRNVTISDFIRKRNEFSHSNKYVEKGLLRQYKDTDLLKLLKSADPSLNRNNIISEFNKFIEQESD